MAASALRTLCRPGRFRVTGSGAAAARSTSKWVLSASGTDVHGAHVGAGLDAVGEHRAAELLDDAAHVLIIQAQHRQPVERQVVQEIHEALLQQPEVPAVGAQVIVVDVGDDGDEGLQVREGGVALVGLGDQVAPGPEARVAGRALQAPADDVGRILAPSLRMLAMRLVVVVLPWVPATAME